MLGYAVALGLIAFLFERAARPAHPRSNRRSAEVSTCPYGGLEYGMKRLRRAVSLTLLVLASFILFIELFRAAGLYPKIAVGAALTLLCLLVKRRSAILFESRDDARA